MLVEHGWDRVTHTAFGGFRSNDSFQLIESKILKKAICERSFSIWLNSIQFHSPKPRI